MPQLVWKFAAMPLLIGVVLGLAGLLFLRSPAPRPPDFWKLAARRPNEAYDWFISHDGWIVVDFDRRRHRKPAGDNLVGPFILRVPKLGGRRVAVYGRGAAVSESQGDFVRIFGAFVDG
jgi:hypothetical protein